MKVTNHSVSCLPMKWLTIWTTRVLAIALVLGAGDLASAQSDRDIREENARLRAQVAELQAELEAAREMMTQLSERIAALERALREAGGQTVAEDDLSDDDADPDPELEVTIDESVPNASPRALFNALVESYEETMADHPIGLEGSRDRSLFVRELGQWVARVNREFRSQIEWHVRVVGRSALNDGTRTRGGERLTMRAVDPVTGAVLGEAFDIPLRAAEVRRLRRFDNQLATEVFILRGVLTPQVQLTPSRLTEGPFNNPPFIGSMAEFAFTVDMRSLVPAPPAADDAGDEGDAADNS